MEAKTLQERFDAKWTPEPNTGCWLWIGVVSGRYGRMKFNGRMTQATHISLDLNGVQVNSGMHVCHRCDTPICVNPAHLFCGSQIDNMMDRSAKHRTARGTKNGSAKANDEMVKMILQKRALGVTQLELAKETRLGLSTVGHISIGRTWKHVSLEGGHANK